MPPGVPGVGSDPSSWRARDAGGTAPPTAGRWTVGHEIRPCDSAEVLKNRTTAPDSEEEAARAKCPRPYNRPARASKSQQPSATRASKVKTDRCQRVFEGRLMPGLMLENGQDKLSKGVDRYSTFGPMVRVVNWRGVRSEL